MSSPAAGGATAPSPAAIATVVLDRCLACGSRDTRPLALAYAFRGARFPLRECAVCGMRFLAVQPAPGAFAELYSAAYFESDYRCGRSATPYADETAFRVEDDGLLAEFARLGPPGRLLEIGSAGGWLLKHARERGWQTQGVEISDDGAAHARALGLEVFHGDIIAAALPAASFDLVYMGDVLEHVPDCRAVLVEVRRVLRPGGHLYLRGPITTHSLARALALRVCGALGYTITQHGPPYHLWEFRPRPLVRLCRAVGLEPVSIRQSKIPPGHTHGAKSAAQRAVMNLIDGLNLPLTNAFNARGDRVVLLARAV